MPWSHLTSAGYSRVKTGLGGTSHVVHFKDHASHPAVWCEFSNITRRGLPFRRAERHPQRVHVVPIQLGHQVERLTSAYGSSVAADRVAAETRQLLPQRNVHLLIVKIKACRVARRLVHHQKSHHIATIVNSSPPLSSAMPEVVLGACALAQVEEHGPLTTRCRQLLVIRLRAKNLRFEGRSARRRTK